MVAVVVSPSASFTSVDPTSEEKEKEKEEGE